MRCYERLMLKLGRGEIKSFCMRVGAGWFLKRERERERENVGQIENQQTAARNNEPTLRVLYVLQ